VYMNESNDGEVGSTELAWRVSGYCDESGCVEVALRSISGSVYLRDGTDPSGPALTFSGEGWRRFLGYIRGD
jgi:hypothetical protein